MSPAKKALIKAINAGLIIINPEALLLHYAGFIEDEKILPVASSYDSKTVDILCQVVDHLIVRDEITEPIELPEVEDAPDPLPSGVERLKIVRVERRESKNNKRPQWELSAIDGTRIWLTHFIDDDAKDAYKFLLKSDYATHFDAMKVGEVQRWQWTPITLDVKQNGKFRNIVNILPRMADEPDTTFSFMPQRKLNVIQQAKAIESATVIDVESTGLGSLDQVIQIGMMNTETGEIYDKLVQPTVVIAPAAREVNGITEEQLAEAWQFDKYAEEILTFLESAKTIIGFNIQFDLRIIKQTLKAHELPELIERLQNIQKTATIIDVKPMIETFIGDPYSGEAQFRYQSLQNAANWLGIELTDLHNALADTRATWSIVEEVREYTIDPLDAEETVSDYFEAF